MSDLIYCFKYDVEERQIWREEYEYTHDDTNTICVNLGDNVEYKGKKIHDEESDPSIIKVTPESIENNDFLELRKINGRDTWIFLTFNDDVVSALEAIFQSLYNTLKEIYPNYKSIKEHYEWHANLLDFAKDALELNKRREERE